MSAVRKVSGYIVKRVASSTTKSKCQPLVTLNEMPTPEGDFFKLHKQRNLRHDSVLALGIVMLTSAVYSFATSKINLNWEAPETYETED